MIAVKPLSKKIKGGVFKVKEGQVVPKFIEESYSEEDIKLMKERKQLVGTVEEYNKIIADKKAKDLKTLKDGEKKRSDLIKSRKKKPETKKAK